MVAEVVDYVVGVDTHRDVHTLALVEAASGAVLAQRAVASNGRGYAQALRFAQQQAGDARLWAVEGAGHYGAGLARYLSERGETVLEVGRSPRGERRLRGKDDQLARSGPPALRSGVSRCRGLARESAAGRCGCCWSPVAAPSTSAARRSCNCAA
jgi:transposase